MKRDVPDSGPAQIGDPIASGRNSSKSRKHRSSKPMPSGTGIEASYIGHSLKAKEKRMSIKTNQKSRFKCNGPHLRNLRKKF